MNKKTIDVRTIVGVAIFLAIIAVLQALGSFIRFGPFSISLVLIPIVVGAALYGPWWGAWLGFFFGIMVFVTGDANLFFGINPLGTIATVLVKGALAGLAAGLIYKLMAKVDASIVLICKGQERWGAELSVIVAAIIAPVVNTGIFLLGCRLFFLPTVTEWSSAAGYENVGKYMILGLVGGNFLFELLFNVILSPVIVRLIKLGKNRPQYTT